MEELAIFFARRDLGSVPKFFAALQTETADGDARSLRRTAVHTASSVTLTTQRRGTAASGAGCNS
eukprot:SAG11_NODE_22826_length_399_cov_1.193333_1_plen_64_part_10